MICANCRTEFDALRAHAKYCSSWCKYQSNKTLDSKQDYFNSTKGRAKVLLFNAKSRSSDVSITEEFVQEKLENGFCEVTGIPFTIESGTGKQPFSPSLDRINPAKGYTVENTRLVVWMYNAAKNVFSDADVLFMAKNLTEKSKEI